MKKKSKIDTGLLIAISILLAIGCDTGGSSGGGDRTVYAIGDTGPSDVGIVFYISFPEIDARKFASANTQDRLNKEIRKQSKEIGVFPSASSYIRLISSYLIEYDKDWQTGRCYIKAKSVVKQQALLNMTA